MKKICTFFILLIAAVLLCGCAENPGCDYERAREAVKDAETVYVYLYGEEKGYDLPGDKAAELLAGTWTPASGSHSRDKVASVVVGTQQEICLFADGSAMIYNGYAEVWQSDRRYYTVQDGMSGEALRSFIAQNGTEAEETKE